MYSLFLATLFSFSLPALAMQACGSAPTESKYKDLNWHLVLKVKVNNSFQETEGVICAGIAKNDLGALKRITYRDIQNRVIDADINQLKTGIVIVSDRDLPAEASLILRPGKYVAIKLTEPKKTPGANLYPISLRFLRNLSMGFSSNDYRELPFTGIINTTKNIIYTAIGQTQFDEVEMNLATFPVVFDDIIFYQKRVNVKQTTAYSLKQVPSLL
ncbi:MAG: hypothetical protein ACOYL6_04190 [Bacteriovoracaceae bacterium]